MLSIHICWSHITSNTFEFIGNGTKCDSTFWIHKQSQPKHKLVMLRLNSDILLTIMWNDSSYPLLDYKRHAVYLWRIECLWFVLKVANRINFFLLCSAVKWSFCLGFLEHRRKSYTSIKTSRCNRKIALFIRLTLG